VLFNISLHPSRSPASSCHSGTMRHVQLTPAEKERRAVEVGLWVVGWVGGPNGGPPPCQAPSPPAGFYTPRLLAFHCFLCDHRSCVQLELVGLAVVVVAVTAVLRVVSTRG
jgi:hypothetical protein